MVWKEFLKKYYKYMILSILVFSFLGYLFSGWKVLCECPWNIWGSYVSGSLSLLSIALSFLVLYIFDKKHIEDIGVWYVLSMVIIVFIVYFVLFGIVVDLLT